LKKRRAAARKKKMLKVHPCSRVLVDARDWCRGRRGRTLDIYGNQTYTGSLL
jgi:hypothetical protein